MIYVQHDTASILRQITRRFGQNTLAGLTARGTALTAAGGQAMGDPPNALNLASSAPGEGAPLGLRANSATTAGFVQAEGTVR